MSQAHLEGVIRTLHKELADKIDNLQRQVTNQARLIDNQDKHILELKAVIAGNGGKSSVVLMPAETVDEVVPVSAPTGRPIRQVRLAKIAAANSTSASKKKLGKNTGKSVPANNNDIDKSLAAVPCAPESAQLTNAKHGNSVATRDGKTGNASEMSSNTFTGNAEAEWTTVTKRRKNSRQRKIVTGTGKADDELQTVERLKHIQAWSFKPETTTQTVLKYLNKIKACDKYTVVKRDIRTDKHASFIIGFPESMYDVVSSPTAWPSPVRITEWFLARRRGGVGIARGLPSSPTEQPTRPHVGRASAT